MKRPFAFATLFVTLVIFHHKVQSIRAEEPSATNQPAVAASAHQPLNILFLFTDDQRWDTVHALSGNPQCRTPNIDRLAKRGFVFTNTYCQGSWSGAVCLPSRIMVQTGESVWRIRQPNPGRTYLPQIFNAAGYETLRSGKGGNTCREANPLYTHSYINGSHEAGAPRYHVDRAVELLESLPADRPFFIQLAFAHPHDPRNAPPDIRETYEDAQIQLSANFMPQHPFDNGELRIRDEKLAAFPRTEAEMRRHLADYYATIEYLDSQIGRLLDVLDKTGRADRTLIVFSSDQGLAVGGRHGLMGKQNLYEHVKPPLIFAGPGIPKGKSDALVYLYDLYPTFCDYTGLDTPKSAEGFSLRPIIEGRAERVREYLYGAYKSCQRMIRDDRYKLMKYNVGGVRTVRLFDLTEDPDELVDLSNRQEMAPVLERLSAALREESRRFDDPVDIDAEGGPTTGSATKPGPPAAPGRPVAPNDSGIYVLEPETAKIFGNRLQYQPHRPNLGCWLHDTDYPQWTLADVRPGQYRVEYMYGTKEGGTRFRIESADRSLAAQVQPTGGLLVYKAFDLGNLELPSGKATVRIVIEKDGLVQPMNFRRMTLTPITK